MVSKLGGASLKRLVLVLLIILTMSFSNAEEFKVGLSTGKVILRPEVKDGEREVIPRTLSVINRNTYPVKVKLSPGEEIKDVINLIDEEIELEANEEKEIRFNIILEDSYSYSGRINFFFTRDDKGAGIVLSYIIEIIGEKGLKEQGPKSFLTGLSFFDNDESNDDLGIEEVDQDNINEDIKETGPIFPLVIFSLLFIFIIGGFIFFLKK